MHVMFHGFRNYCIEASGHKPTVEAQEFKSSGGTAASLNIKARNEGEITIHFDSLEAILDFTNTTALAVSALIEARDFAAKVASDEAAIRAAMAIMDGRS